MSATACKAKSSAWETLLEARHTAQVTSGHLVDPVSPYLSRPNGTWTCLDKLYNCGRLSAVVDQVIKNIRFLILSFSHCLIEMSHQLPSTVSIVSRLLVAAHDRLISRDIMGYDTVNI